VRHLRTYGVSAALISTEVSDPETLVQKARNNSQDGRDRFWRAWFRPSRSTLLTRMTAATRRETLCWPKALDQSEGARSTLHVVAYDFGIKLNILRMLVREGCRVTVVSGRDQRRGCFELKPDGVFLSTAPETQSRWIMRCMPFANSWGACRSSDLPGPSAHRACAGGKTYKLKFGHHGGNHPVKNNATGKVEITAHNHNYAVDPDSINANEVELTHVDLNDQTLERHAPSGRCRYLPSSTTPKPLPAPHDSNYLFHDFRRMMEEWKG